MEIPIMDLLRGTQPVALSLNHLQNIACHPAKDDSHQ